MRIGLCVAWLGWLRRRTGLPFGLLLPLTWIPFDPELIDESLLSPDESEWIESYHKECVERLTPHLPETERYELRAMLG